jgi:hypothetical protein
MFKVLLMGGLGNQLFQLAAGLSFSNDGTVLVGDLGKPRRNDRNVTELESFSLPRNVKVKDRNMTSNFSQKMLNYGIRIGARSNSRNTQIQLIEKTSALLNRLGPANFLSLRLSCGPGYDQHFYPHQKAINVGYFQSYKFLQEERVMSQMLSLRLSKPSETFLEYEKKAQNESPIVVHIRLGDYASESSFGIPSKAYYENGIRKIQQQDSQTPIWVFSNEPYKAVDYIPEAYQSRVFVVPTKGLSSAETLELMRKGSGYVIANSTFSWWGAMLSNNRDSKVVAPSPWFFSGATPNLIYPDKWIRIAADFENTNGEAEKI